MTIKNIIESTLTSNKVNFTCEIGERTNKTSFHRYLSSSKVTNPRIIEKGGNIYINDKYSTLLHLNLNDISNIEINVNDDKDSPFIVYRLYYTDNNIKLDYALNFTIYK